MNAIVTECVINRQLPSAMQKQYDDDYFSRWYPSGNASRQRAARLVRKAAVAVSAAEYFLERPINTVLDIGCGIGEWQPVLKKLRPKASYLGFDASAQAVARFGRKRNLHQATFADFSYLRPCPPVDLLICSDVMHYLSASELRKGITGLSELCQGVAFLETYCREDTIEGDMHDFQKRPAAFYRKQFANAGFQAVGIHCWIANRDLLVSALEKSP